MLFGEYLVLDGAKSLSVPLKFGQSLEVTPSEGAITWKSVSLTGEWFTCRLDSELHILETNDDKIAEKLQKLLLLIKEQRPELDFQQNFTISANFPLNWGIGSSSTLVSLVSQWAEVDPYSLLDQWLGGSGYDIACATASTPIIYQILKERKAVEKVEISKNITDKLLFVYSNKKQSSAEAIKSYKQTPRTQDEISFISDLSEKALEISDITQFEELMNQSESFMSKLLNTDTIKSKHFNDYPYSVKSLGAWGGDFFMASFRDLEEAKTYFLNKGYDTQFTYREFVL